MCSAQGQMPLVVRKQLSFNMHGHGTCSAHHIYGKVLIVVLFLVLGKQFFSICMWIRTRLGFLEFIPCKMAEIYFSLCKRWEGNIYTYICIYQSPILSAGEFIKMAGPILAVQQRQGPHWIGGIIGLRF